MNQQTDKDSLSGALQPNEAFPAQATADQILLQDLSQSGILTLTLNRPLQFNALSHDMLDALLLALNNVPEQARVIVIAANGKAFCAGHDLKEMRAHIDEQWQKELFDKCSHFMQKLTQLRQPVIAKVQGVAAAAGCQLVANCDLAIAADNCRFGVSGINLGLFCSTPSVALSRNISRKRAFEMLVTGNFIEASRAVDWGLINTAVPAESLDEAVAHLCQQICEKSAVAVSTGKHLFYQQIEQPMESAYALAASTMACNMLAEDVSEGIDSFFEKRKPEWKDK
ncbi:MAG: enoyl-CoA hydratase [Granulosicoccus sp.]